MLAMSSNHSYPMQSQQQAMVHFKNPAVFTVTGGKKSLQTADDKSMMIVTEGVRLACSTFLCHFFPQLKGMSCSPYYLNLSRLCQILSSV